MCIYCTNVNGQTFTVDQYRQFMCNKDNAFNCEACPENSGFEGGASRIAGPCGQQNCWVNCTCGR